MIVSAIKRNFNRGEIFGGKHSKTIAEIWRNFVSNANLYGHHALIHDNIGFTNSTCTSDIVVCLNLVRSAPGSFI